MPARIIESGRTSRYLFVTQTTKGLYPFATLVFARHSKELLEYVSSKSERSAAAAFDRMLEAYYTPEWAEPTLRERDGERLVQLRGKPSKFRHSGEWASGGFNTLVIGNGVSRDVA